MERSNREIKFRGLAGNVWRYGDYETYYFGERVSHICTKNKEHYDVGNTVGQYTGVKDKNGKEIYEGDIIRFIEENCLVNYVEKDCAFRIEVDSRISTALRKVHSKDYEVIGNIHENSELLEAKNE